MCPSVNHTLVGAGAGDLVGEGRVEKGGSMGGRGMSRDAACFGSFRFFGMMRLFIYYSWMVGRASALCTVMVKLKECAMRRFNASVFVLVSTPV